MKRFRSLPVLCLLLFSTPVSLLAQIDYTTVNYQFSSTSACFMNPPPGPVSPTLIGPLNHYTVSGGVDRTVNEIVLNAGLSGSTTSYGVYYPFDQAYKYTITVEAMASSSTITLGYSTSQSRCATASSCSPGPYVIGCSAEIFTTKTNLSTSAYTSYVLIENYIPGASFTGPSQLKYLLLAGFNSANSIGTLKIRKLIIKREKICTPPVINSVTPLGNRQFSLAFTPSPNSPAATNNVVAYNYHFISIPFPTIVIDQIFTFTNIGNSSPVTITLPPNAIVPRVYNIVLNSSCSTTSSGTSATIN